MLARAKGVSSKKIMSGHVFRNAFVPLVQLSLIHISFIINTVTPPNFTDLNGVDFSEVGDLAAISARDSFQSDKALEYKEKAVEELTACLLYTSARCMKTALSE